MINADATGALGRPQGLLRKGWKPGAWAIALFLAWLALLAVPLIGLYNLDAFAPMAAEVQPKPWMPIYSPII
ncbi:hypothetical protein VAR608DRAFT_2981 [Variovorax sp. HW608]|uniref:hypothetical protein n=1 Tax=Variovorax sp. HW608 TaxID=1034889 RepID=UPI00081F9DF7|nr:hypothetical protein [Variovorax sp. HW608]SCK33625.1 hypothetical protein VAR608DRAFT_2981 [Variovorax sp. HW608]